MTTTDVATKAPTDNVSSLSQFITRMQPEIQRALPKGMDGDRIARLALTVVRQSDLEARKIRKPESSLANCSVESFGGALLTASALGLEPGVNGEAYLVPYKGECTLIIGYQGFAKLFWQHPLAAHLDAQAVYENDEFDYWYGVSPNLVHRPAKGERGKVTHYWAAARLSSGAATFVVLTAAEAKALRGGKVGPSGKIPDPMHWMERKTALRQLFKLTPKSTTLSTAIAVDEQRGSVLADRGVPSAIASGDGVAELPPTQADERAAEQTNRVTADEITGEVVEGEVVPTDDEIAAEHAAALNAETQTGMFGGDPE